jgi:hypothetical protein
VKKSLQRLLKCLLLVALAALLAAGIEWWRGSRALQARLRELKAQGEKLSVAELKPERIADPDNAGLALLVLSNRLSAVMTNLGQLPPSGRMTSPGRMILAWRLESWVDDKVTNTWGHIAAGLATDPELAVAFRSALERRGFDLGFDYDRGFTDFPMLPLVPIKEFAQWQSVNIAAQLRAGHTTAALESLTDGMHFIERQKSERLIISQLVRMACGAILWNSTWAALQSPGLTEAQLAPLQTAWQSIHFSADMTISCEMERAMTLADFERLRRSRAFRDKWVEDAIGMVETMGNESYAPPTRGFTLHHLHLPLWRAIWIDQDIVRALELWRPIIAAGRTTQEQSWLAVTHTLADMDDGLGGVPILGALIADQKLGLYDRCRFLVSGQSFSVSANLALKAAKLDTQRGMAIAAIALERFRLRNGEYPERLATLVPEFLEAVPGDYMDGEPLKYNRKADGSFVLYSSSENCKDDGGKAAPVETEKSFPQIWQGLDAVWPSPATDEEAQAALKASK